VEAYAASVLAQVQLAGEAAPSIAYGLIAFGTAVFGNLIALPAILLALGGAFGPGGVILAILAALAGQLFGDATWYTLGRLSVGTRFGAWVQKKLPLHERIARFFETGSVYVLITSKLLTTPTIPILFLLGWHQVPLQRYVRLSLISALAWLVGMVLMSAVVYSGIRLVF
jgi:membrane protein DedA with SNARE-associated domain